MRNSSFLAVGLACLLLSLSSACSGGGGGGGGGSSNEPPVANDDTATTEEDVAVSVDVLANDVDADEDSVFVTGFTLPADGTVSISGDGTILYTPDPGFNGTDSFVYSIGDGRPEEDEATVTVTVSAIGDAPIAFADTYDAVEDTTLTITALGGVLGNDVDDDSQNLTVVEATATLNGALTLLADGSFVYEPDADFHGTDSFSYTVDDGAASSDAVSVTIVVAPVNDAPSTAADAFMLDEDTSLTVPAATGVLANDADLEDALLSALVADPPANGTLALGADGSLVYTPAAEFSGTDSFTYTARDGAVDSVPATVTLTVNEVNDLPIAVADAYATAEDAPLSITAPGVLANDTDPDSTLTAVLVTPPANGSLTLDPDGSFLYTPDANFNGPDSFTYQADDGAADSGTVTVDIDVLAVEDAPVAGDDAYQVDEDAALTVNATLGVLANDSDVDSSTLFSLLSIPPDNGSVSLQADGSFLYTPDPDFFGTDTFTYLVSAEDDTDAGTVTITVNDVPESPSEQIQTVRSLPDGTGYTEAIQGAIVTFKKPAVGNEPAGFFLQSAQTGPAIFVAVDDPSVQAGDAVDLFVTDVTTVSGMRHVTGIQSLQVVSSGNDVSGLIQDVSSASDLVTNLDSYEAELITIQGRAQTDFTTLGVGFHASQLSTTGIPSVSSDLVVRIADTVFDAGFRSNCTIELVAPLWRFGTSAQATRWDVADFVLSGCNATFYAFVTNDSNPVIAGSGIPSVWSYNGVVGVDGGNEMCNAIGGDHVCSYEEMLTAAYWNEFASFPEGQEAWVHRTTTVFLPDSSPPGAGGRCNDWTYPGMAGTTNLADGEWATFTGGAFLYNFDANTCFTGNPADGCAQGGALLCGNTDTAFQPRRAILCCHP